MLKDMALSAEEKKEMAKPSLVAGMPKYPYGLTINIDSDTYEKLMISKVPALGDKLNLEAIVEVKRLSDDKNEGDAPRYSMELQIVQMGLEEAEEEKKESAVDIMYGSKES